MVKKNECTDFGGRTTISSRTPHCEKRVKYRQTGELPSSRRDNILSHIILFYVLEVPGTRRPQNLRTDKIMDSSRLYGNIDVLDKSQFKVTSRDSPKLVLSCPIASETFAIQESDRILDM